MWEGRGATARPREAKWSSGVASVFLVYCNKNVFNDPFGHHYYHYYYRGPLCNRDSGKSSTSSRSNTNSSGIFHSSSSSSSSIVSTSSCRSSCSERERSSDSDGQGALEAKAARARGANVALYCMYVLGLIRSTSAMLLLIACCSLSSTVVDPKL